MSFIYKYETCILNPFVKPSNTLNLAIQNIFYVQLYVESSFTYNPGLTFIFKADAVSNDNSSRIFLFLNFQNNF